LSSSLLGSGLVGVECAAKGGRAVIASRRLAKDSVLAVWGGDAVRLEELKRRPVEVRRLTLQIDEDAFLISTTEGPADWVNHSCEPNAGLRGQVTLVAMRTIERGEEVCFDYSMADGCDYDEFVCHCGTSSCRGRISGDDWKRPELLERYVGYRSPYLERRIEALRRRASASLRKTAARRSVRLQSG